MKQTKKEDYKPIPFWSWNDELKDDKLKSQIKSMKKFGVGGFFMHARGGLKTSYLSEEWFRCIDLCVQEGEKEGIDAWVYDENGWPSGFVGGLLLEEEKNKAHYLTYKIGDYDENSFVSYGITDNKLVRTNVSEEYEEYLNLYDNMSVSNVDILNPEVTEQFIEKTHRQYKARYGKDFSKKIKGFFTDEPQYYRWDQPYTPVLESYFKEKYDEDIFDNLGLLFLDKEGYREFRFKFWKSMQELMLNNFAKKVYDFCDDNNVKLTGHYIEEASLGMQMWCCAGIMPFYEYEHIPGIDNLTRICNNEIPAKQVGSVARQLGKKQVLTESFALCGWDVLPREIKSIVDFQYVNGVNFLCHHLFPYSERGQRKRDYPAHYSEVNPWIKEGFYDFNKYVTELGYLLGESEEIVNIGMLHPVRSAYFDYKREKESIGFGIKKLDNDFSEQQKKFCVENIPFHFIDETILSKYGSVENDCLVCGKMKYKYVVLPTCYTMDESTYRFLKEYVSNGGKILLMGEKPEYIGGQKANYDWLESNVTFEDIKNSVEYNILGHNGLLRSTLRKFNGKNYLFVVNTSDTESVECDICIDNKKSFIWHDLINGKEKNISSKGILFKPLESKIIESEDVIVKSTYQKAKITIKGQCEILDSEPNLMALDRLSYSYDGVNYTHKMNYLGAFNELLKSRHKGKLYLKYDFEIDKKPETINVFLEKNKFISVKVNNKNCDVKEFEKRGETVLGAEISKLVKKGTNSVIVELDYFQSENVYYVLFGENVTESLKNCLVYDSEIEAIYLSGDFGVYEKNRFIEGKSPDVYLGNDFYIGERKKFITNLIKEGYPFYSGCIKFRKHVDLSETNVILKIEGRWHLVKVYVNGKMAGKLLFDSEIDISDYTVNGSNEIVLEVVIGNRNLLGPHHYLPFEEPLFVAPETFELPNTWKNGISSMERESYSFLDIKLFD